MRAAIARAAILVALCAACSERRGEAVAASGDPALAAYRADLRRLMADETAALAAVAAHTGASYTDDATLLAALRATAIPRYRAFVAGLERIQPGTADLRAFHDRFLAAARLQLSLLERQESALAAGDATAILFINQEQRRVRAEMDKLVRDFDTLTASPQVANR